MSQFGVLLLKEWRENVRNYKVFWIPAVFVLLGMLEPVTQYFLPDIIDSVGNLPEGAVFEFPTPEPEAVLTSVMSQYQFIGLLVLILAFMGSVAGERKSGTATLLYVRPLSYPAYFLSKWTIASAVSLFSVWSGLLASYYYIVVLFETINAAALLRFAGTYSLWILLVVSVVLAASAVLPNPGAAAAAALVLTLVFQLVDSLIGMYWTISPFKLPTYAAEWLTGSPDRSDFWWAAGLTAGLAGAFIAIGVLASKRNASNTKA